MDDKQSAFPSLSAYRRVGDREIQEPSSGGMSLRDYFAARAMQAAATNPAGADGFTFEQRAEWAYQQADAMLAARGDASPAYADARTEAEAQRARILRLQADEFEKKTIPTPEIPEGFIGVPCALCIDLAHSQAGWLFVPHVDGGFVSAAKLDPFSIKIIQHFLAHKA